jgi:hypothetical protein
MTTNFSNHLKTKFRIFFLLVFSSILVGAWSPISAFAQDPTPDPVEQIVEDIEVWINGNNQVIPKPTFIGNTYSPTEAQLANYGIKKVLAPGVDQKYWVWSDEAGRFLEMSDQEKAAIDQAELEAEMQIQQARFMEIAPIATVFRWVLHQHFGENAETDHNITEEAVTQYFIQRRITGTSSPTDASDAILLQKGFDAIKTFTGDGTSWSFPWDQLP